MPGKSETLTVTNAVGLINHYVGDAIKSHAEELIKVMGIVKNVFDNRAQSGWYYFDLTDDKALVHCATPPELKYAVPAENDYVTLFARIEYYMPPGKVIKAQLRVIDFTVSGNREIVRIHLNIIDELHKKGMRILRTIPRMPRKVGVLTSPASVAYDDIKANIGDAGKWVDLVMITFDGRTADSLVSQLKIADNDGCDVIIIARGGGTEGMQIFDNYDVGKTIAEMKTPVITAIGHSTDRTLSDLVAAKSVSTPGIAGRLIENLWNYTESRKTSLPNWIWISIIAALFIIVLFLYLIK